MTLIKVFNRLSENCQDFLCSCMQQRFSKNEVKKYQMTRVCTATDLRNHPWLSSDETVEQANIKKKKSQFNLHKDDNVSVILSLKELLNVSSDWLDVKSTHKGNLSGSTGNIASNSTGSGTAGGSSVPADF
jgi:hypothetical protein